MKPFYYIIILITLFATITSCSLKNDTQQAEQDEIAYLNNYIARLQVTINNDTTIHDKTIYKTSYGLYYIIEKKATDNTDSLAENDIMEINYTGSVISNGNVIETNDVATAKAAGILPINFIPGTLYTTYSYKNILIGFYNGLGLMKKGAKYKLIIPSNYMYGANSNSRIPAYSTLAYDVELVDIVKNPKAADSLKILLLKTKLGQMVSKDTLGNSIFYKEDIAGTGKNIIANYNSVELNYRISLVDGRFIRNDTLFRDTTFVVGYGHGNGDLTFFNNNGINFGLTQLKLGSKAKIIVPYTLTFGVSPYYNSNGQLWIPACTSLYYEVEVKKIN